VGTRWLGVYLVLYTLSSYPLLSRPVRSLSLYLIHVIADPSYAPPALTGSGDTLVDWYSMPVLLVLTALVVAGWSIIDRSDREARRFHWFIWVWARYYLAAMMMSYGVAKLLPLQFPELGLARLTTTYGDSSPMGLLWRFMGHSPVYGAFGGGAEVAGALLLVFRRTSTLGAMLLVGVLANVVVLNFAYDVPVKLFSSHLLLVAGALAIYDRRRWLPLLGIDGVPARDLSPPVSPRTARILARVVKPIVLACAAGVTVLSLVAALGRTPAPQPALYGIYDRSTDSHDPKSWIRIVVEYPAVLMVTTESGQRLRLDYTFDGSSLHLQDAEGRRYQFQVEHTPSGLLVLRGEGVELPLRLTEPHDLVLRARGFHWVTELPFNR
jgi:hypothetical protein